MSFSIRSVILRALYGNIPHEPVSVCWHNASAARRIKAVSFGMAVILKKAGGGSWPLIGELLTISERDEKTLSTHLRMKVVEWLEGTPPDSDSTLSQSMEQLSLALVSTSRTRRETQQLRVDAFLQHVDNGMNDSGIRSEVDAALKMMAGQGNRKDDVISDDIDAALKTMSSWGDQQKTPS